MRELASVMKPFRKKPYPIMAVQWEYDFKGGASGPLPPGFIKNPPPTDFGVSSSAYHPALNILLHPGDWLIMDGEGHVRRLSNYEFAAQYEPSV